MERDSFTYLLPHYKNFLRSLNSENGLMETTIELIQKSRSQIKKLEVVFSKLSKTKEKKILPLVPIFKKDLGSIAQIAVPKEYGEALVFSRREILHNLYRSFVHNMSEEHKQHPSLKDFLSKI